MKNLDPLLIDLLSSNRQFYTTEIYVIDIVGSDTPILLTSLDIDISVGGVLYKSSPIYRGAITETTGVTVSDLTVTWPLKNTDVVPGGNVPILHAMRIGVFDNAILNIHRVFSPEPWYRGMNIDTRYLVWNRFCGVMDIDRAGLNSADIRVSSLTKLFDVQMPRNLYNAACNRVFYGVDCGVTREPLTVYGSLTLGGNDQVGVDIGFYEGDLNMGVIVFTSGANYGVRRSIRYSKDGIVSFMKSLTNTAQPGDTFFYYPGCPKTYEKCRNKQNFRGFPYIPTPETSLGST